MTPCGLIVLLTILSADARVFNTQAKLKALQAKEVATTLRDSDSEVSTTRPVHGVAAAKLKIKAQADLCNTYIRGLPLNVGGGLIQRITWAAGSVNPCFTFCLLANIANPKLTSCSFGVYGDPATVKSKSGYAASGGNGEPADLFSAELMPDYPYHLANPRDFYATEVIYTNDIGKHGNYDNCFTYARRATHHPDVGGGCSEDRILEAAMQKFAENGNDWKREFRLFTVGAPCKWTERAFATFVETEDLANKAGLVVHFACDGMNNWGGWNDEVRKPFKAEDDQIKENERLNRVAVEGFKTAGGVCQEEAKKIVNGTEKGKAFKKCKDDLDLGLAKAESDMIAANKVVTDGAAATATTAIQAIVDGTAGQNGHPDTCGNAV